MASPPKKPDLRRGLSKSENETAPVTPPARYISSNYSTPGSTYGKEDDAVILELSPRCIKAGIEGESHPQIRYDFKPEKSVRLGDYRQHLPGYTKAEEPLETWGAGYELWKNDLRDFDLGLLGDKLERAVREIYYKHLLLDVGSTRLVLVVPSLVSHPVLATILQTLFQRWAFPSITLLPSTVTALVAAGLRSGLVVEIGWEETVVTAIYEYREVKVKRSTRALKALTRNFATWAKVKLPQDRRLDLHTIEDFLSRICQHMCITREVDDEEDGLLTIQWPTATFTMEVKIGKNDLQELITNTLLGSGAEEFPDDEEVPLQHVLYTTLLQLPPDVRGVCISRIVFSGEGAETFGLQSTITNAFETLLERKGWTDVNDRRKSTAGTKQRQALAELAQGRAQPADVKHDDIIWSEKAETEERYLKEKHKHAQPSVHGIPRVVNTLGSWAGASLLTTLKVKSFVEIQREKFLSHGLAGASKDLDMSVVQQRMSTIGLRPNKAGERTSWTLAAWG